MSKTTKTKNPCIVCCKQVKPKNGIQCRGACKKWAHFDCLKFTPEKIKNIKKGCEKVTCPCPGCVASRQKDTCGKEGCPENMPKECPSGAKITSTCYPEPKKCPSATETCPMCSNLKRTGSPCSVCELIQNLPKCPAEQKPCSPKRSPKPPKSKAQKCAKSCEAPCSSIAQMSPPCSPKAQKSPPCSPKAQKSPPCSPKAQKSPPRSRKASKSPPCSPKASKSPPCSPKASKSPPCSPKGKRSPPCSPKGKRSPPCSPKGKRSPPCLPKGKRSPPCSPKAKRSSNAAMRLKLPLTNFEENSGMSCCTLSCPSLKAMQSNQVQCPGPASPLRQSTSWSCPAFSNQNLKCTLDKLVCTVKDLTGQLKDLMCEISNMESQKVKRK